jgi:hypothetical protein
VFVPLTSKFVAGEVVPMPTLPDIITFPAVGLVPA